MSSHSTRPIGIFDSGIGGLTVMHAVTTLLPHENIIYFGDTAHLPYGDKSAAAIQAYSIKICDMLLKQNCKLILIACNSASAAAFELVQEYIGKRASVMNVIDPVVDHVREYFSHKRLGLIGTKQTVYSNVFDKKITALNVHIDLTSLATPLLAPMIEEGYCNNKITETVISEYLSHPELNKIEGLILACTHYPLIKHQVMKFYNNNISIIDSAEVVARALKAWLEYNNLVKKSEGSERKFYVSDYTPSFENSAKIFFQDNVTFEHYPL